MITAYNWSPTGTWRSSARRAESVRCGDNGVGMTSSVGDRRDLGEVHGPADDWPEPREPDDDNGGGALIALTLARVIVGVVLTGFAVVALLMVIDFGNGPGGIALAVAALSGLLGLQIFYFGSPHTNPRSAMTYAALLAQAGLAYLPMMLFGQAWISQPVFLAGSVLTVLPMAVARPAFVGIVAATTAVQAFGIGGAQIDAFYIAVNTATNGLAVYGLTRLARLVTTLHEARDELAKTAVAHERLRFARDLHELLGLSLSAIAPKGALILRLVRRNPARAKQELAEILEISRRALADVRSIARMYREISLDDEKETLASMLAASDVELKVELDHGELPPHMRTALAAVLREGVAYVLRHSRVERCEIVVRQYGETVAVDIVNDGVETVPDGEDGGYDSLETMVSRMSGELAVGTVSDGRFRLHVTLPVTGTRQQGSTQPDHGVEAVPHLATKLAAFLGFTVFFGFFVQAVMRLYFLPVPLDTVQVVISIAYLTAALAIQLAYFSRPGTRLNSRTAYAVFAAQALVVYVPMVQFQEAWTGVAGFLAGSALLVFRPVLGWTIFAAVVGTVAWAFVGYGAIPPNEIGFNIITTINNGLITYGLTWMARSVRQLRAARQEQAEVALAETRLRFARDLHDLLGLSLSAITLKSELAYKLVLLDPARARDEMAEVLDISRHALADVRSVASGYHEMSLEEECRTAQSLLATADLDVRMAIEYGDLPPEVRTVLATVLREGVTNVLRHSKGECCEIAIRAEGDRVHLLIVNDGVTEPDDDDDGDHWGSGIRNMSDRVATVGGELVAGFQGDGRFRLCARVPS